jgi:hypothetical protein
VIKNKWFAGISFILLIIFAGFVIERLAFIRSADTTDGTVISVDSRNGRCGGGRRKRSYACTRFESTVEFVSKSGARYTLLVSSGSARGQNQPRSKARLQEGSLVPVIYDPTNPASVYENTVWGVWGMPILLFFLQIGTFIASFFSPNTQKKL